jgi:hypothetical protein
MLYINGTIFRKDGKRMTQKRAEKMMDAFLEWVEETHGCLFGGSFNPACKDGDYVVKTYTMSGPYVEMAGGAKWFAPKPKRKKKR